MRTPWEARYAFYLEHRRCGELDGGVDSGRVWMACECGAALGRMLRYTTTYAVPVDAPEARTLSLIDDGADS
jgi:hypothetical protein